VTPVSGTYEIAYNGSASNYPPYKAGTYQVLVTFTSGDPTYGNATVLTNLTINQAAPAFSNLSSPTIAVGAATTIVSGNIADGTVFPSGDYVIMTLNGVSQETTVGANGNFSSGFATGSLPVGSYTITYTFAGDANFNAASDGNSTLTVVPLAAPVVTLDPSNHTVSAGDLVTFTAGATGSPTLTVQWQVSTDGGQTFTNITGNASATTTTLSFYVSASQNGYKYRAVFTNSAGSAITLFATLTVESDGGGGD
jgi:plastocyanin